MIYAQAYLDAMNYAVAITVVAVLVAIILVLFMRDKKKVEVKTEEGIPGSEEKHYESESGVAVFTE